jgi:hypothetical protein
VARREKKRMSEGKKKITKKKENWNFVLKVEKTRPKEVDNLLEFLFVHGQVHLFCFM